MGCCKCCDNTKELGCILPCGIQVVTGAVCPIGMQGEWTLFIKFARRNYSYKNTFIVGQEINFSVGCLDAYYKYSAYILNADKQSVIFEIEGNLFDCFTFETQPESLFGLNLFATSVIY